MFNSVFENTFFERIILSTFKGNPEENVQDWLSELDDYLDAVNATSAQKVTAARLLMKDSARRWLKFCPAAPATTDPWIHFKACLLARFQSAHHTFFDGQDSINSGNVAPLPSTLPPIKTHVPRSTKSRKQKPHKYS